MTEQEIKTALIGKRLWWGQPEPYKWHSIDTITDVDFEYFFDYKPANCFAHVYISHTEYLTLALRDAETLATKGRCKDGTFSYSLRKEKGGQQ